MKRKFRTLISCLLIASLCIGLLSATALAADPAGTVEDPTVIETKNTETKPDTPAPGQTTTTTTTEKKWNGTTTEGGTTTTVKGEEKTTDTTVTGPDKDLLDQTGTIAGSETTTTTPGEDGTPTPPSTDNVADSKPDGSVEVTVEPGKNTKDDPKKGTTGSVSAWLKDKAVPDWANDDNVKSERDEDGTVTNIEKTSENTYTKTVTKPDGSVTVETVTLTKDEQDRVTGYTRTTETTGSVTDEMVVPEVPDQATVGKDGDTTYSFELPEKPEITTPVQRDEADKPVSGEEVLPLINTSGNVIGYTKVTYTDGKPSYSDPVLGAYYATTTKIETLENGLQKITTTRIRVTDTKVLEEALSVSDGKWSLSGWMGDVKEGANNGNLTYDTPQPGDEQFEKMRDWQDNLGVLREPASPDSSSPSNGELKYVGYGLYSNILLGYYPNGGGVETLRRADFVHQFKLKDADEHEYYAYCADWSTDAVMSTKYELVNVLDASYIKDKTAREHLQAIAENGYWGTEEGVGSLEAVKKLVDEKYRGAINDGIALAVTQAALWKYGNQDPNLEFGGNNMNGSNKYKTEELLEFFYGSNTTDTDENGKTYLSDIRTLTPAQRAAAVELYKALIEKMPDSTEPVTDIITKEDIKNATIRVKEKTKDGYNTDLSFTLTVDPSHINGKSDGDGEDDVTLNIYVGGKPIKSHKLRDAKNASDGSNTFTFSYDPETGKAIYTVNGLEFTADTDITLNLSGKQTLKGGAYLFRSDVDKNGKPKSQTFIGLVNGTSTRDLNLNVTLGFHVVDPIIKPDASASSRDKHTVTWTASYHTEWPHTPDQPPEEPEEPETPETPETPVTPVVPGYDVPKTGDASGLYYVLVILSALGLALVTCAGRKRRTA